ncbi:MAG: 4-(cytidine 5'-diphospho)-2-C-methyl-D-erythritol kinase [Erysipelotrichia bacterium]|nr:4-(cytidine 5'-diphospho)-2-C-methyl-D-erythritol kinase [Erysipelotrichia bacterium]
MKEKAYGKINLSLNVINRRIDGYHNIDSIMLPVDLYDEIELEIADSDSYECNIDLPYDQHNIIYKCLGLMRREFDLKNHYSIKVTKNIPLSAGLAGGSSDGAAVLRMINELEKLGLSYSQLACFGKKIGADIPFCIYQQAARVRGIGEIVEPFHLPIGYELLLIKPQLGVDTASAYQMLDLNKCQHPNIEEIKKSLLSRQPLKKILGNSLQYSAFLLNPEVENIICEVNKLGYANVLMSGSGSTVFVLGYDGENLDELKKIMQKKYAFVYKTTILTM